MDKGCGLCSCFCRCRCVEHGQVKRANHRPFDEVVIDAKLRWFLRILPDLEATDVSYSAAVPFACLVGPTDEVEWEDALIGFSTFYHLLLTKGRHAVGAVEGGLGKWDEPSACLAPAAAAPHGTSITA